MLKKDFLKTVCVAALAAGISTGVAASEHSSWAGFYGGGHVGYGEADIDVSIISDGSSSAAGWANNLDGGLIGGHIGYNWLWTGNTIFGLEADLDYQVFNWEEGSNLGTTDNFFGESDFLGSLRARLGTTVGDDSLLYVTAGVAYTNTEVTFHAPSIPEKLDWDWGGVFGAGIEHRVAENLTVRAEGLYYLFGEEDWICRTSCGGTEPQRVGDVDLNVFTFRVGFSWAWGEY